MMSMTKIYNQIFWIDLTKHPLLVDPLCVTDWAENLLYITSQDDDFVNPFNEPIYVFEQITYGITYPGDPSVALKCHVDKFNDRKDGVNTVFCIYFHIFYEPKGKSIIIVLFGYFRKVITDYYQQQQNYETLERQLNEYYLLLGKPYFIHSCNNKG